MEYEQAPRRRSKSTRGALPMRGTRLVSDSDSGSSSDEAYSPEAEFSASPADTRTRRSRGGRAISPVSRERSRSPHIPTDESPEEDTPAPARARTRGGARRGRGRGSTPTGALPYAFDQSLYRTMRQFRESMHTWGRLTVIPGRDIEFTSLSGFGLYEMFHQMGWASLASTTVRVYPALMHAFFYHATIEGDTLTTRVRTAGMTLTPDLVCEIMDVPAVGFQVERTDDHAWPVCEGFDPVECIRRITFLDTFPQRRRLSGMDLRPAARLIHIFIGYSLLPIAGHRNEVSVMEAFLIDSIMIGRPVHYGHLVFRTFQSTLRHRRSLPHGRLLTCIFQHFDIDMSQEVVVRAPHHTETLNMGTVNRMHLMGPRSTQPHDGDDLFDVADLDVPMPPSELPEDAPIPGDPTRRYGSGSGTTHTPPHESAAIPDPTPVAPAPPSPIATPTEVPEPPMVPDTTPAVPTLPVEWQHAIHTLQESVSTMQTDLATVRHDISMMRSEMADIFAFIRQLQPPPARSAPPPPPAPPASPTRSPSPPPPDFFF